MWNYALAVAILTTGCAGASSTQIANSPDRYDVTCRHGLGNCHEEAARVCPSGYTVVDRGEQSGAVVSPLGNSAMVTPVYKGEIIVECSE